MSPIAVGLIGIGILFILLFSRMPIAFAMAISGIFGIIYLIGLDAAFVVLGMIPYRTPSYTLAVLPLFILMGALASTSGLSRDLYSAINHWVGHLPGGLAMATVGGCGGFAAISGSSVATAAAFGEVSLPEMKRYGYDPALATGCVAAGGTLGILIPPSMGFILYGLMTEQSIGKLFSAGILPGIMQALFYIIAIYVRCRLNPNLARSKKKTSFIDRIIVLKGLWETVVIFLLVMGGIYLGIFTPTEAAAVGALGVFLSGIIKKRFNRNNLIKSGLTTANTTGMIFALLIGALIFAYFLALSEFPFALAGIVTDLQVNRYFILMLILFVYIILGCIMESLAMVTLTVPIFFPIIMEMGFDPIWFGVILVIMVELALITPPVGLNVFIIKGIAKDVPLQTIYWGILPFLIANIILIILLIIFPQIALFLPNLMSA